MLYCYEDRNPDTPVDARGMSDGTLRLTATIVSLLTLKPGSLLIIEEVDNGLHPSRARELVKVLKEISAERQIDVLCTTHNPVLMDELGNEMIPFISFVKRDKQGNSFSQLLEDKENLAKLMASGTVGDMMKEDVL
jgi:predicted ATPase